MLPKEFLGCLKSKRKKHPGRGRVDKSPKKQTRKQQELAGAKTGEIKVKKQRLTLAREGEDNRKEF